MLIFVHGVHNLHNAQIAHVFHVYWEAKMRLEVVCIFFLMVFGIVGCSSSEKCKSKMQTRCTQCHSIKKICVRKERRTEYWNRIVDQMIQLNAKISLEDKQDIVRCLSDRRKMQILCENNKE